MKRPFVGKTGNEVNNHYLPLAGVRRNYVRFTNAIACLPDRTGGKLKMDQEKDRQLVEYCANHHLYPEIERMQPRTIVAMGAFANYALDPNINLELQHGIPVQTDWGIVFPMYHPAMGIHEPKKMLMIRNDWIRLRKYIKGELHIPVDEYVGYEDYRHLTDPGELDDILCNNYTLPLAGDTETYRTKAPFCLTFSVSPGTGYLIHHEDQPMLDRIQHHLDLWEGPILFHNWLFDYGVTRAMRLRFRHKLIVDTMVRVFHLGNLPQGLKALAYRELGMSMEDFDDVVKPHSTPVVLDYYRDAFAEDWPKPDEESIRQEDGTWKIKKPQGMNTKLKRFFTDYRKNIDKDVFNAWEKNWKDSHDMIEAVLGPWPGKCISHVPFDLATYYACRDADALLRLWPILKRMKSNIRRISQDRWREAA